MDLRGWRFAIIALTLTCLFTAGDCTGDESRELGEIVDEFWEWRLYESPEYGTKVGLYVHMDRVEEFTESAFLRQKNKASDFLTRLDAIDISKLQGQDVFSYKVLQSLLQHFVDGYPYRKYGMYNQAFTLSNPVSNWKQMISQMPIRNETDYDNILARLSLLPTQFSQLTTLMRKAMEEGTMPHEAALTGVVESYTESLLTDNVTASFFYEPFTKMPATIDAAAKSRLQQKARNDILNTVFPAIEQMRNFIRDEYSGSTRALPGVSSLPGGAEFYQQCLNWHLSVEMTPQEVHDIGLSEVARISALMEKIKESDNFQGTLQEYRAFLLNQSRFYYDSEEAMLEALRGFVRTAHGKMSTVLRNVPSKTMEIRKLDNPFGSSRYSEPSLDGTRPGIFWANVWYPETKPNMRLIALALHEAEPGHHTQISYALEQQIPLFRASTEYRKYTAVPFNWLFFTSYAEGWALYAEALGEEMGVYSDKYYMLGRYSSEIFRACRLVVDTGIHGLGWSKERAIEYMANYTFSSRGTIENEINRYIGIPGQACAYKIGELKIKELRSYAEEKLGDNFDLLDFHEVILQLGASPLTLLEERVTAWVAQKAEETSSAGALLPSWLTLIITLFLYLPLISSNI